MQRETGNKDRGWRERNRDRDRNRKTEGERERQRNRKREREKGERQIERVMKLSACPGTTCWSIKLMLHGVMSEFCITRFLSIPGRCNFIVVRFFVRFLVCLGSFKISIHQKMNHSHGNLHAVQIYTSIYYADKNHKF